MSQPIQLIFGEPPNTVKTSVQSIDKACKRRSNAARYVRHPHWRHFPSILFTAVVLCILQLSPLYARELSLSAALERASTQATQLQRLQKQHQLARATHTRSAQTFLPRISADSTWIRADADALEHVPSLNLRAAQPGITTQDYGPVEGIVSGINIAQPLIHVEGWMSRSQAEKAARARASAAEWGAQVLKFKTVQGYFAIHVQDEVLQAALQAYRAAQQALKSATANYAQGLVGKLDVTRARAEDQSAQARVFAAETELSNAKIELAALLGFKPLEPLKMTTPLPTPLPPASYPLPRQQRADIASGELMQEAAAAGVDKAQARILPKLNLLARQQWVDGDAEFEDNGDAWLVGVNLEWNLFDGLDRVGEISEARAHENLTRVENEEMLRTAKTQQHKSFNDWVASWKAWQASRTAVESAATAAELATRRYSEGLGNLTDVLLTRAELFKHRVDTIRFQYNALLAGMSYYLYHGYNPLQGVPNQVSE
jgi:outer membrane protein TolC